MTGSLLSVTLFTGFYGRACPMGSQDLHLMDVDKIWPTSWPAQTPTSRWPPSGGPVTSQTIL